MNFKKDFNALNIPWVESPFFPTLVEDLPEKEKDFATEFNKHGFTIIDLNLSDEYINNILNDVDRLIDTDEATVQQDYYTYSDSPRVFEAWKQSENVRDLTLNDNILGILRFLYQREPFPFSTINFKKSSNQPLHSDAIHFNTSPPLWMVGVWVALEDVDDETGTLQVVPGSHKWQISSYDYENLNLPIGNSDEENEKNYRIYEDFIRQIVDVNSIKTVKLKKGQALIWASNLIHGGTVPLDKNRTRNTQAIHYMFEGCDEYYHPMFSRKSKGEYAKKWCDGSNNIREYNSE